MKGGRKGIVDLHVKLVFRQGGKKKFLHDQAESAHDTCAMHMHALGCEAVGSERRGLSLPNHEPMQELET